MLLAFKRIALKTVLVGMFIPMAYAGGSVDLSLSNDTFRLGLEGTRANTPMQLSAAWLHDEDKGEMGTLGFHVVESKPRNQQLYIGVGATANFVHLHDVEKDTGAVAVGGFARYEFLRDVSVAGYAYYAPRVLSFAKTENMINSDLRFQYSIIPSARIFAGYRYVGYRLKDDSKRYKIDDGLHVGLSLDF